MIGTLQLVEVAKLVRAAAVGDESAWHALVDRYRGLVWSVARGHSLGHADAADVSQTTWLRFAESLHSIREPDRVAAWLTTCARRESLRLIRARRRESPSDVSEESHGRLCESPEQMVLDQERDAELWRAFETLPERSKVLLRAMLADPELSYAELSEALDMPIGSIGPTRARCLAKLRVLVSTHGASENQNERDTARPRRKVS